ncbi:MAG: RIP metalloprotease RseP [Elusimicrobiota bacterium]
MLVSIIAVVFTFGLVIFIHEFGHFLVCKISGIAVENFSFGFGKELLGFTRAETRYSIRAVPLGGFVRPKGEDIEEHKGDSDEYFSKPWYIRLAVVWAGPFMNYLLAFAVFFFVILSVGQPVVTQRAVIGDMMVGYPAAAAGLKEKDRIVSINGVSINTWEQMTSIIHSSKDKELKVVYERDGALNSVKMTPVKSPVDSAKGIVGIAPITEYVKVSPFKAFGMSAYQCWYWTAFTVKSLAQSVYRMEKPDVSGPIGIVSIVSKAAHSSAADFFFLLGLISIAVGFFNLLPIPLLDGGHSILFIFEGLTRKKLTPNIMRYVNSAGMALLLGILVFATYNDVKRIYDSHLAKKAAAQQSESK